MRVTVVTPCFPRFEGDFHGGFIKELCDRLSARGIDLHVLAPRSQSTTPFINSYVVERFPYLPYKMAETLPEATMKGAPVWRLIQLPMYLTSAVFHMIMIDSDIIHSHLAIPFGFLSTFSMSNAPRIITCHGSDCSLPFDNPFYLPFTKYALHKAQKVIAVSKFVANLTMKLGVRNPETIYLGVDTNRFAPSKCRRTLRTKLGIPEESVVIGTLGRLVAQKRIMDLIDAFKIVSNSIDAFLIIGGQGPEMRRLQERSEGLRNVLYTGVVTDAPSFHSAIDIFALPSNREGLSISLQEAMATECVPVAASGCGSEEVIEDGENGYLFEAGNIKKFSEKIIMAANNPRLGIYARGTILSKFNSIKAADRYVDVYTELAR